MYNDAIPDPGRQVLAPEKYENAMLVSEVKLDAFLTGARFCRPRVMFHDFRRMAILLQQLGQKSHRFVDVPEKHLVAFAQIV